MEGMKVAFKSTLSYSHKNVCGFIILGLCTVRLFNFICILYQEPIVKILF